MEITIIIIVFYFSSFKAEFQVQIKGTPLPKLCWYKDGFELFSSRRTKIVTEGDISTLVIYQAAFSDEGEIKCTATNRVGHVVTKARLRLEGKMKFYISL